MDGRFLSPVEVKVMMQLARKLHAGEIPTPPEITLLNREIREKMRQAKFFTARLGEVDMFLVDEITDLRFQKDAFYTRWIKEHAQHLI